MYRKLATLLLLVPISLNGLWMVCADGRSDAASAQTSANDEAPAPKQHCKFMCPIQAPTETGAICVLTARADGSIALFAVAVMTPPVSVSWISPGVVNEYPTQAASIYAGPSLVQPTPPPEA